MTELIITRSNHLVDPYVHVWAWQIPVYLFLGGWVAGMMAIAGYFLWQGRHRDRHCTCVLTPWLGIVLLSLGMLALFLDLEHKPYFWRLYTTFEIASPMSWGAWILVVVYPALAAAANTIAVFLQKLGIQPGERVCLFMDKVPELYFGFLGILKMGAIAQPLFSAFGSESLLTRLEDAGTSAIFTQKKHLAKVRNIVEQLSSLKNIIVVDDDETKPLR